MEFEKISELVNEQGRFIDLVGLEILDISLGHVKGAIHVEKKHTNPLGVVHGGCIYTMADTIAGMAANTHGEYVVTTGSSISFLAPAIDTATIMVEAEEVRHGHKLSVYDVKVYNDQDEVIGIGTFHFYSTGKAIE